MVHDELGACGPADDWEVREAAAGTAVLSSGSCVTQFGTPDDPDSPQNLFVRWFVAPLQVLRKMPYGDGGFVALSTACYLWERYAIAVLKDKGLTPDPENRIQRLMRDFEVEEEPARVFWNVIRNGLNHQGMPMRKRQKHFAEWDFRASYRMAIRLVETRRGPLLQVQPWLFAERVVALWTARPDLLTSSTSFPWASVYGVAREW